MSTYSLRDAVAADAPLLLRIFASASPLGNDVADAERAALIGMQHRAQEHSYRNQFPDAERSIVCCDGVDAGRQYVWRSSGEIRLLDLSLLPGFRGRGLGSTLIRQLQGQAAAARLPLRLKVADGNPARHLYDQLGFQQISQAPPYTAMEWRAPS